MWERGAFVSLRKHDIPVVYIWLDETKRSLVHVLPSVPFVRSCAWLHGKRWHGGWVVFYGLCFSPCIYREMLWFSYIPYPFFFSQPSVQVQFISVSVPGSQIRWCWKCCMGWIAFVSKPPSRSHSPVVVRFALECVVSFSLSHWKGGGEVSQFKSVRKGSYSWHECVYNITSELFVHRYYVYVRMNHERRRRSEKIYPFPFLPHFVVQLGRCVCM